MGGESARVAAAVRTWRSLPRALKLVHDVRLKFQLAEQHDHPPLPHPCALAPRGWKTTTANTALAAIAMIQPGFRTRFQWPRFGLSIAAPSHVGACRHRGVRVLGQYVSPRNRRRSVAPIGSAHVTRRSSLSSYRPDRMEARRRRASADRCHPPHHAAAFSAGRISDSAGIPSPA